LLLKSHGNYNINISLLIENQSKFKFQKNNNTRLLKIFKFPKKQIPKSWSLEFLKLGFLKIGCGIIIF